MTDAKKKRPRDANQLAKMVADIATGEVEDREPSPEEGKNPKSVLAGQKGGQKGGVARAKKLSSEQRRKIAQKAAKTRWNTEAGG